MPRKNSRRRKPAAEVRALRAELRRVESRARSARTPGNGTHAATRALSMRQQLARLTSR